MCDFAGTPIAAAKVHVLVGRVVVVMRVMRGLELQTEPIFGCSDFLEAIFLGKKK